MRMRELAAVMAGVTAGMLILPSMTTLAADNNMDYRRKVVGIAGIMNNSMAGVNQTAPSGATPPPVPVVAYHVAVNGQATGPFDLNVLQQMATSGQFNADSLVWKNGMSEWVKAGTIDELKSMFVVMPPIPPVE